MRTIKFIVINKLTSTIRATKSAYITNFINNDKLNARAMWQLINTHLRHKSYNNSTSAFSDFNELNDHFTNLGTNTTKHLKFTMNYKQYLTNPIEKVCL